MSWLRQGQSPHIVYTDGSCLGRKRNGAGGWAAIIVQESVTREIFGGAMHTTNNRMELTAAIKALQSIAAGASVFLHTDSQYLKHGMLYWMDGWKRRNWKSAPPQSCAIANKDLWLLLDVESQRHLISWHWIKGHGDDPMNLRCDALAGAAARKMWEFGGQYDVQGVNS